MLPILFDAHPLNQFRPPKYLFVPGFITTIISLTAYTPDAHAQNSSDIPDSIRSTLIEANQRTKQDRIEYGGFFDADNNPPHKLDCRITPGSHSEFIPPLECLQDQNLTTQYHTHDRFFQNIPIMDIPSVYDLYGSINEYNHIRTSYMMTSTGTIFEIQKISPQLNPDNPSDIHKEMYDMGILGLQYDNFVRASWRVINSNKFIAAYGELSELEKFQLEGAINLHLLEHFWIRSFPSGTVTLKIHVSTHDQSLLQSYSNKINYGVSLALQLLDRE